MIKALIFDFDGVILESSHIKTLAFQEIFAGESREIQEEMNRYHLENMGFSRRKKFEYFYSHVLMEPVDDKAVDKLCEKFEKLVYQKVLAAPFVPGMPEFLTAKKSIYQLYIATGTPTSEIQKIVEARGLERYFSGVFGTPAVKEEIIEKLRETKGYKKNELVFFGDAESDRRSAEQAGIPFIGRMGSGSEMMKEVPYKINNFKEIQKLESILNILNEIPSEVV